MVTITSNPSDRKGFVVSKQCSSCGETKEILLFSKNRRIKSGFKSICKACASAHTREKGLQYESENKISPPGVHEKECPRCNRVLSVAHFGRYLRSKDGLKAYCKECHSASSSRISRRYTIANLLAVTVTPSSKKCKDCCEVKSASSFHNRMASKDGLSFWCKQCEKTRSKLKTSTQSPKDHFKQMARRKIQKAILRGSIDRMPCIKCGNKESHAHHEDYSKPLDVMWLCVKHHAERHMEIKREEAVKSGI